MEDLKATLPPGQWVATEFPRFGPPAFADLPDLPSPPVLQLVGDVEVPSEVGLEELANLPRHEQESDLHCVATWSRCGLHWSGYRLRDIHERLIVPRARPHPEVRYLLFRGLDGFWASLSLEDALSSDVLLADRLDGEPLSVDHGAPIRLVAPAHYGYKSVKHLGSIELYIERSLDVLPWQMHPRARVAEEERTRFLPGRVIRPIFRAGLPMLRRRVRQAYEQANQRRRAGRQDAN
ncbi:MAG: molybdopterin-dependent oxidoreductase [Acidobacteria bacterium]|nr:molybdopterin-dependent oxidoreductase [Acidobacteriota bacterium]